MPFRLKPLLPVAEDVIVVGDPRRAFALAQALTEEPRMSHQARGLWGYAGRRADGRPLTVQSTGVGAPSAVAVVSGLIEQGARRLLRLGTATRLGGSPPLGGAVLVGRAVAPGGGLGDRLVGPSGEALPDPGMAARLEGVAPEAVAVSDDLPARLEGTVGGGDGAGAPAERAGRAVARDMQTAAVLALAAQERVPAAALLILAEAEDGEHLDEPEVEAAALALAERAEPLAFPAARPAS